LPSIRQVFYSVLFAYLLNICNSIFLPYSGNVYIADTGNNCIRKVTVSTGIVTTIAGKEYYTGNTDGGDGGAATSARLNEPEGVALDSSGILFGVIFAYLLNICNSIFLPYTGNVYIADTGNNCIRKVTVSTGIITTIAGTGTATYSGDGGAATSAGLNEPEGVALDSSGILFIIICLLFKYL
jgi:hypothetical protein